MPPDPVPNAVMTVSPATPKPKICWPTAKAPLVTAVTDKVVPDIEPVKLTDDGDEMRHVYLYAPSTM